jgi:peptide-methionine (R)-S-oxide reductase
MTTMQRFQLYIRGALKRNIMIMACIQLNKKGQANIKKRNFMKFKSKFNFSIRMASVLIPVLALITLLSCKSYSKKTGQAEDPKGKTASASEINRLSAGKEKFMIKWNDVLHYAEKGNPKPDSVVTKTDAEWRALLTPDQYRITREKETEQAFSSEMCSLFEPGLYACVCCNTVLFDSQEKFESGTGWPSFTQPVKENAIAYHVDNSFGMQRIEVLCNVCGAHLGHVFPDGPTPSGLRYCINALALKKIKK